jgi:hypothetical protein
VNDLIDEVFENPDTMRNSDVDGYTIIPRTGRSPKIHLLRPWNECNTEKAKSGSDTFRIEGGREQLAEALARMGARRGDPCRRCFRHDLDADVVTPVTEYGE